MASTVTLQQLLDFHSIDRKVYARLVLHLGFDLNLSQQVVAFWYWLERKGYRHCNMVMLQLPNQSLYGLAMEAKTCVNFLNIEQSVADSFDPNLTFPLMISLVSQDFSIAQLYKDRERALTVMRDFLKNVCAKIFNDIIPMNLSHNSFQVLPGTVNGFPVQSSEANNVVQIPFVLANGVEVPANTFHPQSLSTYVIQSQPLAHDQAFVANGVPLVHVADNGFQFQDSVSNGAQFAPMMANGVQVNHNRTNSQTVTRGTHVMPNETQNMPKFTEYDRTLFATFSKSHSSITKRELRDLLTRNFGYCVDSIHMRVTPRRPLFALVVLKSASALARILVDKDLVKLSITGKDVWIRRYSPKPPLADSTEDK